MSFVTWLASVRKTVAAVVGSVITWAALALPNGKVSFAEWIALAVAIATALGVYSVGNDPLPVKLPALPPSPDPVVPVFEPAAVPAPIVQAPSSEPSAS